MSGPALLFVYGTLQDESVQQRLFARAPIQRADAIAGHRRRAIPVPDASVAARIGSPHYVDLEPHAHERVEGRVLELDGRELALLDAYERADRYVRVAVTLASGVRAWAYVHESSAVRGDRRTSDDLCALVERAVPLLGAMSDAQTARRPAPGKWSAREILGHLVDSATVNHTRFLRARWQDDLDFDGYDQEAWVEAHGYAETSWPDLLRLWHALNWHVARVIDTTPAPVRVKAHARHSPHRIAFTPVAPNDPATLDMLMDDYVAHLRHHLRQVLGAEWDRLDVGDEREETAGREPT